MNLLPMVISNELGFVLVFKSTEQIVNTIKHLQGQLDWIAECEVLDGDRIPPPYLYGVFADEHDPEKLNDYMTEVKTTLQGK